MLLHVDPLDGGGEHVDGVTDRAVDATCRSGGLVVPESYGT